MSASADLYESDLSEPPEEAPAPILFHSPDDVALLDDALLPAALCATSYAPNCWAFDVATGAADPAAWMGEEQFATDRDALARAMLIGARCAPLSAADLGIDPQSFGATLSRGVWRKGGLSQALAAVSVREDGSRELHLSVRGTDFDNHANKAIGAFKALVGYFAWTYPRIDKHAKGFEPLADAMAAYAANPANRIDRIVLSGHSLGGAAAEKLMPRALSSGKPCQLFTFGSPGAGSGLAVSAARALARGALAAASAPIEAAAGFALGLSGGLSPSLGAFSEFARRLAAKIKPRPAQARPSQTGQFHFRHPNDPIPKLGPLMLYQTGAPARVAMAPSEFERSLDGRALEVAGIGAHSCARYFRSIHGMLARALEDVAPCAEPTEGLRAWHAARVAAVELENLTTPEQAAGAIAKARQGAIASMRMANPNDPAIARLLALPEPAALPHKIRAARTMRKIVAAFSKPQQGFGPA